MKYFILIMSMGLVACTSLSKRECATMNWEEKGRADGMEGESLSTFTKYQKECSKHHIMTDKRSYERGRSEGLMIFCTYDGGYDFGSKNGTYRNVCTKETEANFFKGYNIGKKEYELKAREAEIERREEELEIQARKNLLDGDKECSFDSDCRDTQPGDCSFGQCKGTSVKCSFDSDCRSHVRGRCESRSKHIHGEWIRVNACTYR